MRPNKHRGKGGNPWLPPFLVPAVPQSAYGATLFALVPSLLRGPPSFTCNRPGDGSVGVARPRLLPSTRNRICRPLPYDDPLYPAHPLALVRYGPEQRFFVAQVYQFKRHATSVQVELLLHLAVRHGPFPAQCLKVESYGFTRTTLTH